MHSALLYVFLLTVPCLALSINIDTRGYLNVNRIPLPPKAQGPESLAFDQAGVGPYTGISDGRILKFVNTIGFVEFGVTSPNRPKILCDGSANPALEPTCGRPLGLGFYFQTGDLYVADSSFGLVMINKIGGNGNILASSVEGVRFRITNGLGINQNSGIVYFVDTSSVYSRSQANLLISMQDRTGRLLSYDIRTRELKVLLRQLGGPTGVSLSQDGSFLLISEIVTDTIRRFWLTGPRANTSEVFAHLIGMPDNIRRNSEGEFWVASTKNTILPPGTLAIGLRLDENGGLKQNVTFNAGSPFPMLSEVQERNNLLYLGFRDGRIVGTASL